MPENYQIILKDFECQRIVVRDDWIVTYVRKRRLVNVG